MYAVSIAEADLQVDGGRIFYKLAGPVDGFTVLLLHGFPDSSELWKGQQAYMARQGFRTVAPDLRGFGRSHKPVGAHHYRLHKAQADVVALLDHLQVRR